MRGTRHRRAGHCRQGWRRGGHGVWRLVWYGCWRRWSTTGFLQHLDSEGCSRVIAEVLSELPQSSILVVAQATGFASRDFDAVDTVIWT